MEVDTATSVTQASGKHSLPELEIYCYLLVLIFLIDTKRYNEVEGLLLFNLVTHVEKAAHSNLYHCLLGKSLFLCKHCPVEEC